MGSSAVRTSALSDAFVCLIKYETSVYSTSPVTVIVKEFACEGNQCSSQPQHHSSTWVVVLGDEQTDGQNSGTPDAWKWQMEDGW